MILKVIGAILVIFGAYFVGHKVSYSKKRTVYLLQQLIVAFEQIVCELRYRKIPLSVVFRRVDTESDVVNCLFYNLSEELEGQISPDVICCANAAMLQTNQMPDELKTYVVNMGKIMGTFDLDGQIKGLNSLCEECKNTLMHLSENQDVRLRNNRTLVLCAGIAIVILLF